MKVLLLGPLAANPPNEGLARLPAKTKAIFAYLAHHAGQPIARDRLADLAWSRSGPEQARQSLRQALTGLRQALPAASGATILNAGDSVALSGVLVDSEEFVAKAKSDDLSALEAASTLYRGAFLADLPDVGGAFDEWRQSERAHLNSVQSEILIRLIDGALKAGAPSAAIDAGRRLTSHDPLREDGHRLLILALAAAGRRAEALRQYEILADLLRRELKVAPDAATRTLADSLREAPTQRLIVAPPPPDPAPGPAPAEPAAEPFTPPAARQTDPSPTRRFNRMALAFSVGALLISAAIAAWTIIPQTKQSATPAIASAAPPQSPVDTRPLYSVTPLQALSTDPESKALAEALTSKLVSGLGRIPTIRLRASTAPLSPAPDYRIEGNLEAGAEKVHVVARLIDVAKGEVVTTSQYDVTKRASLEMQDEVLGWVGRELSERINQLSFPYPLDTPEKKKAADLAEVARIKVNSGDISDGTLALFQEALGYDKQNPSVIASYLNALVASATNSDKRTEREKKLLQAAQDFFSNLPSNYKLHRNISYAHCQLMRSWPDYAGVVSSCYHTLSILPWSARVYKEIGFSYIQNNRINEALELFETADSFQKIGAVRWTWSLGAGLSCLLLYKNTEASRWLLIARENNSRNPWIDVLLAVALRRSGDQINKAGDLALFNSTNKNSSAREYVESHVAPSSLQSESLKSAISDLIREMEMVSEPR